MLVAVEVQNGLSFALSLRRAGSETAGQDDQQSPRVLRADPAGGACGGAGKALAVGYIKRRTEHTIAPTKQITARVRLPSFANTPDARSSATD